MATVTVRPHSPMPSKAGGDSGPGHVSGPVLCALLLLLAGSGCAALVYEIVWLQLLQLVIGSSAISLGLLLAAYMGGLCLGSGLFSRFVSTSIHPLRLYACIEVGIGLSGVLVLFGAPLVGRFYLSAVTGGIPGLFLRGLIACLCLLPPTILMGASLPAISRWFETTAKGVSTLGLLYSGNIGGAVVGALLAGFYLLRWFDASVATYTAAAINLLVALGAFALAATTRYKAPPNRIPTHQDVRPPRASAVYAAAAISGLSALGAQVVWTRLLSLLLGATVYTFSIILAVFLMGLGAGSLAGSLLAKRIGNPRHIFTACQFLLAVAIAWTAFALSSSLPYWPVDPWLSLNPIFNFQLDVVRCVWAIFPATLLWGASFPLALASLAAPGQDAGQLSGKLYAWNTAGSIAGALLFSLVFIPTFGTRVAEQILIASAVIACAVAAAAIAPGFKVFAAAAAASVTMGLLLVSAVSDVPWELVAYGRRIAPTIRAFDLYPQQPAKVLYRGEGVSSSVVIVERGTERTFYVGGKVEASTANLDMRLERMMGHVPALLNRSPKSVLTVGFGAGVTAGSFVPYPDLKRLVICELEPFIPPASTQFFGPQNNRVFLFPATTVVYDDARHYVFTTAEKFDVITTDPIHPWVKGMSSLYSKQYYELVKSRLNPGGVVAQWLPIYDSDSETIRSELATFFSVFPNGTIWSNFINTDGYDLVLIGQPDGDAINVDLLQQRLDRPDYAGVLSSIGEVGFHSAVELLATYAGRATDLQGYLANAQINEDRNFRLQYLAGMGLNSMRYPAIYKDILSHRQFPTGLIQGAPGGRMDALRTLLRPRTR